MRLAFRASLSGTFLQRKLICVVVVVCLLFKYCPQTDAKKIVKQKNKKQNKTKKCRRAFIIIIPC